MFRIKSNIILSLFFIFASASCNNTEVPITNAIHIGHTFEPIVTSMVPTSIISLPNGVSFEGIIINSASELINKVHPDIINTDHQYETMNYSDSSLISLRFRLFYYPIDSKHNILQDANGDIIVQQLLSVNETMNKDGYFIMINMSTSKLPSNANVRIEQSLTFIP